MLLSNSISHVISVCVKVWPGHANMLRSNSELVLVAASSSQLTDIKLRTRLISTSMTSKTKMLRSMLSMMRRRT